MGEIFKIYKEFDYTLIKILSEKLNEQILSELKLKDINNDKNIILDISLCNYCVSAGLTVILHVKRITRINSGKFVLILINKSIKKLLHITHVDSIIKIVDNIEDAIALINLEDQK